MREPIGKLHAPPRAMTIPLSLLFLSYLLILLLACPQIVDCFFDREVYGLVRISDKNITAYNNRNLTITCHVDLTNRSDEKASFTTNGRMVLTFMTHPRELKPLHQMQSFLHCYDPGRTRCRAEFNLDLSCLEDQMNRTYYYDRPSYLLEAACQVDDVVVCSGQWMDRFPSDCHDLGQITVFSAPKLSEKCFYPYENKTLECGENQFCNTDYGICLCERGYIASNRRCIAAGNFDDDQMAWTSVTNDRARSSSSPSFTDVAMITELTDDNDIGDNSGIGPDDGSGTPKVISKADTKGTLKAIVIFLLVIAILLCIALGAVIIWSRHYRRLLEDVSS